MDVMQVLKVDFSRYQNWIWLSFATSVLFVLVQVGISTEMSI